jgi:epoxyqueuosine reductase
MASDSLTAQIKDEARRLGFSLVGVTTPEPPQSYSRYTEWVEAGMHGEMAYLASERNMQRRADPQRILPECQSILVLGIPYNKPESAPSPENAEPNGRIAAYAWNDDYHDVLKERLTTLVAFIEEQAGEPVANRWYTDTGPILERDFASRAGLGWIGKNSLLIHPEVGSYFLLAEVLLGIKLSPDLPFASDHCGNCTACIEACPTDCITPERTLDATRCISYLTIELKGAIPHDLRPQMGDWVFGCDICQEVCPWNIRFAPQLGDPAFQPRHDVPLVDLAQELTLDTESFNRKFKGSPVKRAKRRGYLRNVAVALGNSADQSSVPALSLALQDVEPLVRAHAAWALGQIGGSAARETLSSALPKEADEGVQTEIKIALRN